MIELVTGPMFSGKTSRLLRVIDRATADAANVVVCKPALDTRTVDLLESHDGESRPAVSVDSPTTLSTVAKGAEVIVLDELHLLERATVDALIELASGRQHVIAAGLDRDFRREPFDGTARVESAAAGVERLVARCSLCGAPAPFTQRLVAGRPAPLSDPIVVIGAEDVYQPRCDRCWRRERVPSDPIPSLDA